MEMMDNIIDGMILEINTWKALVNECKEYIADYMNSVTKRSYMRSSYSWGVFSSNEALQTRVKEKLELKILDQIQSITSTHKKMVLVVKNMRTLLQDVKKNYCTKQEGDPHQRTAEEIVGLVTKIHEMHSQQIVLNKALFLDLFCERQSSEKVFTLYLSSWVYQPLIRQQYIDNLFAFKLEGKGGT